MKHEPRFLDFLFFCNVNCKCTQQRKKNVFRFPLFSEKNLVCGQLFCGLCFKKGPSSFWYSVVDSGSYNKFDTKVPFKPKKCFIRIFLHIFLFFVECHFYEQILTFTSLLFPYSQLWSTSNVPGTFCHHWKAVEVFSKQAHLM